MTGDQLRTQRRLARLSQDGLATILGVSVRTIRRYENAEEIRPILSRAIEAAFREGVRGKRGKRHA